MADDFTLPARPPQLPGLPANFSLLLFDGFAGLNTKATRPGIGDQDMAWCDNFMPLGKNNLRTMYDHGTAIYTTPGMLTISYFTFANIADSPVCVIFLSDGSIIQVNTITMVNTTIAPAGTITTPTNQMGVAQWGSQYIIIVAPQTNGYFIWDGTLLYKAGTVGPTVSISNGGLDYVSAPTVTASGGSGSGVTLSTTIIEGSISTVTVTADGSNFSAGDVVVVAFSGGGSTRTQTATTAVSSGGLLSVTLISGGTGYTPSTTVSFRGGGGFGATAIVSSVGGTVSHVTITAVGDGYTTAPTAVFSDPNNPVAVATINTMPFGLSGTSIETYTGRVWLANGAAPTTPPPKTRVEFSAPASPVDFNTGDGGGSFLSTDSFLRVGFHGLRQSNGFLYLVGDSSVNYISGVTTSGSPPITTFSNQNVDPQIGSPWQNTIQVFSRAVVFANSFGVHALYGGSVQKVSSQLDGIYSTVPIATIDTFNPSSAVAIIFGIHVYVMLMPIIDTFTGLQRNALLLWDGSKWWTASQSVSLTQIATQEIKSVLTAYGTDGTSIYPLFQNASTAITKTVQSKLWDKPSYIMNKRATHVFGIVESNNGATSPINVTVDSNNGSQSIAAVNVINVTWTNNTSQTVTWLNNSSATVTWTSNAQSLYFDGVATQSGVLLGMTLQTVASDVTFVSLTCVIQEYDLNL